MTGKIYATPPYGSSRSATIEISITTANGSTPVNATTAEKPIRSMGTRKIRNVEKGPHSIVLFLRFFKGIANLSPQNLYINNVKHKAFIAVDEEGTEAAAVTSVGIGVTSMPPQISFKRPFVFIIHELESGATLFMGKVENPVWNDA